MLTAVVLSDSLDNSAERKKKGPSCVALQRSVTVKINRLRIEDATPSRLGTFFLGELGKLQAPVASTHQSTLPAFSLKAANN